MLRLLTALAGAVLATSGGQSLGRGQPSHVLLGRSQLGRPITATEVGDPKAATKVLVFGCIHGTECAGIAVAERLTRSRARRGVDLWVVPNLNPDGYHVGTRQNGRGVDLNRNFPSGWRPDGPRWSYEYPGPRPESERETRIAMHLVERVRPRITVWFHQPEDLVRAWGSSIVAARRFAQLAGLRFHRIPWPAGTGPNWQNHAFPGTASFVVELPPGSLSQPQVARYASAVLRLAQ